MKKIVLIIDDTPRQLTPEQSRQMLKFEKEVSSKEDFKWIKPTTHKRKK